MDVSDGRTSWRLGHRPSLDAFRGIAILLVVIGHLDPNWGSLATLGVSLFFSLSGFLITALLLDERADRGRIDLPGFYLRRARRLLPALFSYTAVCLAFGLVTVGTAVPVIFYYANWAHIGQQPMGLMEHTWSLAVEEQFYILWPSLLILALRRGLNVAWWATIAGAIASVLVAAVLFRMGADGVRVFEGSDTRAASLLLGAATAVAAHRTGRIPASRVTAAVGFGILIPVAFLPLTVATAQIQAIAAAPVVGWLAAHPQVLSWRWLTTTGRISYAMYLWQPIVYHLLPSDMATPLRFALGISLTYAVAGFSWFALERHFLRKHQTFPATAANPAIVGEQA